MILRGQCRLHFYHSLHQAVTATSVPKVLSRKLPSRRHSHRSCHCYCMRHSLLFRGVVSLLSNPRVLGQNHESISRVLYLWLPYDCESKIDTAYFCWIKIIFRHRGIPHTTH